LLQVAEPGQCPCGHTEALLRQRLAEVRAELDRLRALETDRVGLLGRQPDPSCPDMTVGAAAWWCAPDVPTSASHRKGGDRAIAGVPLDPRLPLRRLPARLLLDRLTSAGPRDRRSATGLACPPALPAALNEAAPADGRPTVP
jgi:hypothetical protein